MKKPVFDGRGHLHRSGTGTFCGMDLIAAAAGDNLLPHDGKVYYDGGFLSEEESGRFYDHLMNEIPWEQDELIMFGKPIVTNRKVAWFGDENFSYKYSGRTKVARPWTPNMKILLELITRKTGSLYNSCLANLYHHGGEGMSWHSDDEKTLVENASIASLSLGAGRRFRFRHKETKETMSVFLENGSLLEMKGATQSHWQHCLPKTKKVDEPRINLTFRLMKFSA